MTGSMGQTCLKHKPVKVFKYQDLYGIVQETCQCGQCSIPIQCKGSLLSWIRVGNQVITVRLLPPPKIIL